MYSKRKSLVASWPRYSLLIRVLCLLLPGLSACGVTTDSESAPALTHASQALVGDTCITLQRGLEGTVADTQLSSHQPGHTAGAEPELYVGQVGRHTRHGLLRFDTASIPLHATITSASLTLWRQGPSQPATLYAHAITGPWQEASATWEGFSAAFAPQVGATRSVDARPGPVSVSLTELVATWVRVPHLNQGLLLRQPEGHSLLASSESPTVSRRPGLRVCYFLPDSSPATSSAPSLLLQVVGDSGQPLTGASVSWGTFESSTDSAGYLVLDELPVGFFSARIRAPGFAPAVVSLHLPAEARASHQVRLQPLGPPQPFVAEAGATLERGAVRVSIPPHALVDTNGQPVSGTVEATLVPLDPTVTPAAALPGPLEGVLTADSEQPVPLESFLMAEVSLWQEGRPLQLAPGATATLELLLPESASARLRSGDSIPAWWLDTNKGLWVREGTGTVQPSSTHPGRLSWVVEVHHFTWWNCDAPISERSCVDVRVRYSNGLPAAGVQVGASGVSYTGVSRTAYTNAEGRACVEIMRGGTARVFAGLVSQPTVETTVTGTEEATACGGPACTPAELTITPPVCFPGDSLKCGYSGPPETEDVGLCRAERRYCNATGTAWGECEGSVLPATETCLNTFDEDCDGQSNEGCGCGMPCYTGPSGTNGVGVCHSGTLACQMGMNPWCQGQRLPTPDRCGTPEDDDCNGLTFCTTPLNQVLRAGDASCQEGTLLLRSGDSLFVAGSFSGSLDLGHGIVLTTSTARSLFVAKLDKNTLAPVWARTLETTGSSDYFRLAQLDDSGQLLIGGQFSGRLTVGASTLVSAYDDYRGDAFLAKLDGTSGELLWLNHFQRTTQNSSVSFYVKQWDPAGNLLLTGNFDGAFTLGGTTLSGKGSFYASIDHTSGELRWLHHPRSTNGDSYIRAEQWDADGSLLLWGLFKGNLTLGGTTLTSTSGYDYFMAKLGGSSSWLTHVDVVRGNVTLDFPTWDASGDIVFEGGLNGELLIGGTRVFTQFNFYDHFTAKLRRDSGALLWVFKPRLQARVGLSNPIRDPSGDVFEGGFFTGDLVLGNTRLPNPPGDDFFVTRLHGASGTPRWVSHFQATNGAVRSASYEQDADGHILVHGSFSGTLTVGGTTLVVPTNTPSRFLAKLDGATGTLLWATHFQATTTNGYDYFSSLKWDTHGNLLLTGPFLGSLTLGGTTLSGQGHFFAVLDGTTGAPLLFSHFQSSNGGYSFDGMQRVASGNLLLTGGFWGDVTFGDTTLNGGGRFFVWLDRTTGTPLRVHHLDTTSGQIYGMGWKEDAHGDLLLTGVFGGDLTLGDTTVSNYSGPAPAFFAAKLGEASSWLVYPHSTGSFDRFQFTWDPNGNLLLHGSFTGDLLLGGTTPYASNGGQFITEFRHDTGAPAWVQHLPWDQYSSRTLQMEPTGEVFILGALTGTLQVDGTPPVTSAGCSDFLLGRIPAAY